MDMSGRRKGASSRPPNAQTCPWLMFSHGKSNHIQTFYSITDDRILKRMLPHLSGSIIRANYDGWAVITLENSKDVDPLSCFLLHLTTMEKILLPNLEDIEYRECFLSSSPLKPNCVVAFISTIWDDNDNGKTRSRIKFWRPNQDNWVEVIIEEWLSDLITCDGKFYGIKSSWYVMVDIHDKDVQVVNLINMPDLTMQGSKSHTEFLIESCGDVFVVMEPILGLVGNRKRTLQVYKLMQDTKTTKMNWIRLTDIGDRVFFCHRRLNSFTCSATQAGLNGNSIYFTGSGRDTHIYRYSFLENRYYRILPCRDVRHGIRQICWLRIDQSAGLEL